MYSRTDFRSAWVRTARPISRSSQLTALRSIPGLITLRPGDANEVVEAWRVSSARESAACLVLTRQALPTFDRTRYAAASGVGRGAYVLADVRNASLRCS